ncbi:hypothetical protein Ga0609869_003524 [Rhodovulum iodosum]|uniref:Lipoprotein n=1 Tax=Rhodovulum iodosum TaxID=68291 RepID=A0ABV3XXR8_9RHOB|nr:hypothetical protein [Rhodovulum robiginosum]RSK38149.1 hypothetical protein EJA01_02345 [Rhodovulum robiginosum]
MSHSISTLPLATAALLWAAIAPAAEITLTPRDLFQAAEGLFLAPGVEVPAPDLDRPAIRHAVSGPAADRVRALIADGEAAGFAGLVYDNRDHSHSQLPSALYPRLARLAYAPALQSRGLDYGLAGHILLPAIVFGNSSTAITRSSAPRSLPRLAMTAPGWPERTHRTYVSNHIYVYPEHRDHDAVDHFPAQWPYMIVSQGSSGSDKPFLHALAMTLAAFRPDTRDALEEAGLVAPALQMILRRSLDGVETRDDYLSGRAHPTVFDAGRLRPLRMIEMAASLAPDALPPLVRLTVEAEDFGPAAGLAARDERLYDTPSAIARLWRGHAGRREMVLSARTMPAPRGREVNFRWVLLQGDPARVRITPEGPTGERARIEMDWQPALTQTDPDGQTRRRTRIDIGVFAETGETLSAPAIVSVSFPAHQLRRYEPGPDGTPRLAEVDYDAARRGAPFDPLLYWSAPWRDVFVYAPDGTLAGWTRWGKNGREAYGADGRRLGQVTMRYEIERREDDLPVLRAVPD